MGHTWILTASLGLLCLIGVTWALSQRLHDATEGGTVIRLGPGIHEWVWHESHQALPRLRIEGAGIDRTLLVRPPRGLGTPAGRVLGHVRFEARGVVFAIEDLSLDATVWREGLRWSGPDPRPETWGVWTTRVDGRARLPVDTPWAELGRPGARLDMHHVRLLGLRAPFQCRFDAEVSLRHCEMLGGFFDRPSFATLFTQSTSVGAHFETCRFVDLRALPVHGPSQFEGCVFVDCPWIEEPAFPGWHRFRGTRLEREVVPEGEIAAGFRLPRRNEAAFRRRFEEARSDGAWPWVAGPPSVEVVQRVAISPAGGG